MAIRSMQDLLNAGVNAFGLRLVAKDFERMRVDGPLAEPIHVPIPIANGKTIWITLSDVPPTEAAAAHAAPKDSA